MSEFSFNYQCRISSYVTGTRAFGVYDQQYCPVPGNKLMAISISFERRLTSNRRRVFADNWCTVDRSEFIHYRNVLPPIAARPGDGREDKKKKPRIFDVVFQFSGRSVYGNELRKLGNKLRFVGDRGIKKYTSKTTRRHTVCKGLQ